VAQEEGEVMDMSLIGGTVSGLKLASDIAKSFLSLKTDAEVQGKVIELQNAILNAQNCALAATADQYAAADEIRALKKKLADAELWAQERERYTLVAVENGVFTYALRQDAAQGQPPHWLCVRCFNEGKKTLLQSKGESEYFGTDYECHSCITTIRAGRGDAGRPQYA
jgi:hypothetical protein